MGNWNSLHDPITINSGVVKGEGLFRFDNETATSDFLYQTLSAFFFPSSGVGISSSFCSETSKILSSQAKVIVSSGVEILREGDRGKGLYIIERGLVEVSITGEFVRILGDGAVFGELSLIFDTPISASVKTLSECVFWYIDYDSFKELQLAAFSSEAFSRKLFMEKGLSYPAWTINGSIVSNSKKKLRDSKLKVKFNPQVLVVLIASRTEYDKWGITESIWYTSAEFSRFRSTFQDKKLNCFVEDE